jgi:glycosyltransferase involved in cell wall biosynthesis
MVGFREPGYLWEMNKPFVWGPIGGMENTNWKLLLNLNIQEFIFYSLRNIFNTFQKLFLVRPKKAATSKLSRLISATDKNKKDIKKYWGIESVIIPEVGMSNYGNQIIRSRKKIEPLKIVWSGQHTGGKALNILLRSLVKLPSEINWQLDILGKGKMTDTWKKLAIKLSISENCNWHGWLPREDSINVMKNAHILCITSIKDLTSTVTLEGLSIGLPIIAIDHCGFSNVINSNCGIKIPIDYPSNIQKSYIDIISNLYFDDEYRVSLCYGALERAKDFSWDKKIEKINNIYSSLLKEKIN